MWWALPLNTVSLLTDGVIFGKLCRGLQHDVSCASEACAYAAGLPCRSPNKHKHTLPPHILTEMQQAVLNSFCSGSYLLCTCQLLTGMLWSAAVWQSPHC